MVLTCILGSCIAQNTKEMEKERLTYFSFDHHNTMVWHSGEKYNVSTEKDGRIHIKEKQHIDPVAFEEEHMHKIGLIPEIISRYRSPYFQHIFTTGYDAGYYSYTWTAILDADAFEAFAESGDLFNPDLAKKFRHLLESGNTVEPMDLYRAFRGKDPSPKALLKRKGML